MSAEEKVLFLKLGTVMNWFGHHCSASRTLYNLQYVSIDFDSYDIMHVQKDCELLCCIEMEIM